MTLRRATVWFRWCKKQTKPHSGSQRESYHLLLKDPEGLVRMLVLVRSLGGREKLEMAVMRLLFRYNLSSSLWPMDCSMPGLPSCPSSRWYHPTISSSVIAFSCLQSFPASGSFPMSWLFKSSGQKAVESARITSMESTQNININLSPSPLHGYTK